MKKIFVLIGLATLVAAVSCQREKLSPDQPVAKVSTEITLTTEATKTTIGGLSEGVRAIYWANGDQVNVNGVVSDPLAEVPENTNSVTFTFTDKVLTPPFNAIYPASLYKDASTITVPASIPMGIVPLSATGDMSALEVKPLTAILKVTVKKAATTPDEHKVVKVILSSEDTRLSGDFAINYETGTLTPAASPTDEEKTLALDKTFYPTDEGYELFIPVPAGTYGLKLKLVDNHGHYMEVPTSAAKTFVAGQVKALAPIEFAPTGTQIDVVINSAADLIQFAQTWNSGAYVNEEPIVHVTSDIVFDATSSAEFSATNGIGTSDYNGTTNYFNGLFEGNGHTVRGYTGSEPLFAYTGSGGIIEHLNLADDCIVTVTSPTSITQHGMIVGRHKGTLSNCIIDGNLVIGNIENVSNGNQFYGAFAGRNYGGTIKNCSMQGDVICSQTGVTLTGNYAYIGGVTGYLTDNGHIEDSFFLGNITISDGTEYGGISSTAKTYFDVGGICGGGDKGTIKGCVTSDPADPATFDVRGNLIPCVAGIAGWVTENITISNSYNAANISIVSNGARANTTPCRIGGIAGRSLGTIETCQNFGKLETLCQSTTLWAGGIAGDASGKIIDCTNMEHGSLTRTNQADGDQSNRYVGMGGIVGGATAALTIERCENKAAVLSNLPTAHTSLTLDLGGILGYGQKFAVTIKDCTNTGDIKSSDTANKIAFTRVSSGGIAGCLNGANSKVTGCTNSGLAHTEYTVGGTSNRRTYAGGIVGIMADQAASAINGLAGLVIEDCTNTGQAWSQNYNNTVTLTGAPFGGGIVGVIVGTEESPASVKGCESNSAKALTNYRGFVGGVAGYAGNAAVEGNTISGEIGGNNNATANAGIVCWAVGTSLKDNTFKGSVKSVKNIGGLVYLLDTGSSIDACKVDGATITKGTNSAATAAAVLVSSAASGTTIKDCGVKGTLDGAAITLESKMVTTDNGTTISGTYLL